MSSPITKYDSIDGVPIRVGGDKDLKRVAVKDRDGRIRYFDADKQLAIRIASYLFVTPLRIEGTARWLRQANGVWVMKHFRASSFTELPNTTFDEDLEGLRSIPAKWKELDDPLREIAIIRHEDEIQ